LGEKEEREKGEQKVKETLLLRQGCQIFCVEEVENFESRV
jgi:hypothetical protein